MPSLNCWQLRKKGGCVCLENIKIIQENCEENSMRRNNQPTTIRITSIGQSLVKKIFLFNLVFTTRNAPKNLINQIHKFETL